MPKCVYTVLMMTLETLITRNLCNLSTCDGVSLVHAVDFIEHPNMVKQTLFIYRLKENAEFDIF